MATRDRKPTIIVPLRTKRPDDYLLVDVSEGTVWRITPPARGADDHTWRMADRRTVEAAREALRVASEAQDVSATRPISDADLAHMSTRRPPGTPG